MRWTALAALALALALGAACTQERTCPQGETLCGDVCASLDVDARNCGACGHACGAYQECDAGACGCGPGATDCGGGTCADLATSPSSCGACGAACGGATPVCATENGATACAAACPAPLADCGSACVDRASDFWNCGACGNACQAGESCRGGSCRADVYVACFSTDDVRPANRALHAGLPRKAGDGPVALAVAGDRLYAASSLSHSLTSFSLDLRSGTSIPLGGSDFEWVTSHGGRLFVSNAGPGTLLVWDPVSGRAIDEVPLGDLSGVNPRGVAFVGERAYVALYGENPDSGGQEVVAVDFSTLGTCTAPPCGAVVRRISLLPGADAGGLPFPSDVVAHGTTVYVALANLKLGEWGYYTDPAGDGKLAVVDTAADDAVSYVDLGASCTNPGGLALDGDVLWVACGGGALQPVDVSGAIAAPAPFFIGLVGINAPGKLAFCGGTGYVTDQWSGTVARFDTAWAFDPSHGEQPVSAEICPVNEPGGWAWAAHVACAP